MKFIILILASFIAITFACKPTQEAFEKCNNTPGKYFDTLKCQCLCIHPPKYLNHHLPLFCQPPTKYNFFTKCCTCPEKKCANPNQVFNPSTCKCECKDFLYCFIGTMDPVTCQCPNGTATTVSPSKPCVDNVLCMKGCSWSPTACKCVCQG